MDNNKRVLLLAPPYMDIYKDIISCMEDMGFDVVWVEDGQVKRNPYNKTAPSIKSKTVVEYNKEVNNIWHKFFSENENCAPFDYFLAIDGLMVSDFFFEELGKRNPGITTRLFLYDRVEGNYELDVFFKNYDKIFTFDRGDSEKYSINHLPIYWVPSNDTEDCLFDVFGLGSYDGGKRYEIFSNIKELSIKDKLKDNIHLWYPHNNNKAAYLCEYIIKSALGRKMPSPKQLNNGIFTEVSLSPAEFRKQIQLSKAVLDTHLPYQDGLTARFMWALGLEKKIITTNKAATLYPFYTPEQIFVLDNNYEDVVDFIKTPYSMDERIREVVAKYRIDNWIKSLFDL